MLVEQFPAYAANLEWDELERVGDILNVRDIYRVAGTKDQKRLTPAHWQRILEIDALAAEEDGGT